MSDLVPDGWENATLGSISKTVTSGSRDWAQYYSDSGSKFIRMTNLPRDGIHLKLESMKYVDVKSNSADGKRTSLQHNDILISITAELGKIGWIPENLGDSYINQHTALVRLNSIGVESKFIAYQLSSERMNRIINLGNDSGAKAGLNLPSIKSFPVLCPPLPEQKKIAAILSSVDEVIEKTQAQINKLKDLKTGMMQELLSPREGQAANIHITQGGSKNGLHHSEFKDSPLGRIPVDWEVRKFGDITLEHKQGFYSKDKYTADGTYLIRITDMQNPYISFTEMPKMIISDKDKEAYKVLNGDFLFARSGAIGRYGIFDSSNEAVFASYLIRFRFNLEKALNEFVGFWYESDVCQKQLGTITQGSSNININALNIKELKIPIPSINEQQKITQAILSVVRKTTVFQRKLNTLKNTKKALMQDLLTGKVRVTVD